MNELSDYFRLKEYDRIKLEKECLANLKKVIDLCIKKEYNFNIHQSDGNGSISLTVDKWQTSFSSYFKGSLISYRDATGTMTISQLLEKLKSIK